MALPTPGIASCRLSRVVVSWAAFVLATACGDRPPGVADTPDREPSTIEVASLPPTPAPGVPLDESAARPARTEKGPTVTPADQWPMFRGNAQLTGLTASTLPDRLEVLWTFQAGDAIESSAAIEGERVFVGGYDGFLYALDFETGALDWKYEAGAPISASPAVGDGRVYVGDQYGFFHAVDAATGELVWKAETEAEIQSSANVLTGKVLFGSYDQRLYALDPTTGRELWRFETDGPVHCTPGVFEGAAIISGCDGVVRLIRIEDGRQVGAIEAGSYIGASPAFHRPRAYAGNFDYSVMAFDLERLDIVWEYDPQPRDFPFYSSAAVLADRVVVGGRDKEVHCLNAETGEPLWTFPTRARVDSSPVVAGERVFVGSSDGNLYELSALTGAERSRFAAGAPLTASPAVARQRLIIGSQDGILYCLGGKETDG